MILQYIICRCACIPFLIEARDNINHDEYVEEEDYYNADSDESDIDAN